MKRVLGPAFFRRPTLTVARKLLGKALVRRIGGREAVGIITETEAYDGPLDRASHAHRGRTPRNAPMFGPGGRWYAYFVYGMHWMLNAASGPEGYPAAVLIRGVAGLNGPARLTKALRIDRRQDGQPIAKTTGLWIEDRGIAVPKRLILRGPRIGVDHAGDWAAKPYRFRVEDPEFIHAHAHPPLGRRPAPGRGRPARRRPV